MKNYIAYYRISTKKQLRENISLGIESQKTSVQQFIASTSGNLINEFTEVESGKNDQRPVLLEAIRQAELTGSVLIIAKLDRLSRSVSFLFQLKSRLEKSNVSVKALDLPDFSTLSLGIFAVVAQNERELVSLRTRNSLAELKKTRTLGTPANLTDEAKQKGIEQIKLNARTNINNVQATAIIVNQREQKKTFDEIAIYLNSLGYTTRNGKYYRGCTVFQLYKRYMAEKEEDTIKMVA
jgi:DNA invertase Pin-like site-specific DNA recombinase